MAINKNLFNLNLFRVIKLLSGKRRIRKKIGRNDQCPCGSGKKYKKCHGDLLNFQRVMSNDSNLTKNIKAKIEEITALQKQREQQQGLGRPIISAVLEGYRFVAVANRLYYSKNWKTFHDFLLDYIKDALGTDWGNAELKKDFNKRHPIVQWYDYVCRYQQKTILEPGKVYTAPMTGAGEAYLALAYNLYILTHNLKIQHKLIERLEEPNQFHGAYYETFVAATFIKAGFDLEFENELDRSTTHCEFTATYRDTGNKYSVEAKARKPHKVSSKIGNQLYNALRKNANHKRVIFIDVNVPDDASDVQSIERLWEALADMRNKEFSMTIRGEPAPEAYVFVTNHPYQYNLETTGFKRSVLAEGFKIPEFKMDKRFPSIRDALRAREKHYDMFRLLESIREHYIIPSTFDGEIPEFAFGKEVPKLRIGHKYLIPDGLGKEVMGELIDATVDEKKKLAYGVYKLEDGKTIIASCPLTDDEFSAYSRYPDTFFGVYRPKGRKVNNSLDFFDFLFEIYRHTPKEKLLNLLKNHPNYEMLKQESQKELVITYCEGLVYSALNFKTI